jgi:sialic acid synthase SpsE
MSHEITVRNRKIGGDNAKIFLTAEIGAAHNGSVENAKIMIAAAADAGCDGADIFMASPQDFYYTGKCLPGRDFWAEWQKLCFTREEWIELFQFAREKNIILYPTPLDMPAVELCRELNVEMLNINSDDVNNYFQLKAIASLGIPVTMHDINISLTEVAFAVRTLQDNGCKDIIILHSTQETGEENTLYESANLEVMLSYRQIFGRQGVLAGCVEHTSSDFLIYAVAALRPVLISKHIQLNPRDNESDAAISVKTEFLTTMVKKVRYVEQALGGGSNEFVLGAAGGASEWTLSRRKVLVAARDIPAGKVIEEADLIAKRPGNLGGVNPMQYINLIGATARRDIKANEVIEFALFDNIQSAPYKYPPLNEYHTKADLGSIRGA